MIRRTFRRHFSRPASTSPLAAAVRSVLPIESLEPRRMLAAPQILAVPFSGPASVGNSIFIPMAADDADGDAVSYSVSITTAPGGANAAAEFLPQDNTFLRMDVQGFGTMTYQLFDNIAPETVRRIAGLADTGFYDGLQIFRVVNDFVFQFGSPTNNGQSGPASGVKPDFTFDDEFDPDALFTGDGQLAMANSGKDTNSSQFFVTEGDQRFLDLNHTVFGQLIRGFNVRNAISDAEVTGQTPNAPITVNSVRTVNVDTDGVLRFITDTAGNYTLQVTATDSSGAQETTTLDVNVTANADTVDDPAVLLPFDTSYVVDSGQAITFDVPAADPEGNTLEYRVTLTGDTTGTATVNQVDQTVTYTPGSGFTGAASILVEVRQEGATTRGSTSDPWDKQLVTVGVGDESASGSASSLRALIGVPLNDISVATFTDIDPSGVAGDWEALIDWGDGDVTEGTVVNGSTPGTFEVLGSHEFGLAADGLPLLVTLTGDNGARVELLGRTDVVAIATLVNGTLQVNGSNDDDEISIALDTTNADILRVVVNDKLLEFAAGDVNLAEIFAAEGDDSITLGDEAPASRVFAGGGNDSVRAGLDNDEIFGEDGNDQLDGHGGNDLMEGGAGNDYLMGGTGINYDQATQDAGGFDRDSLLGGDGNDTLSGGLDVNDLEGGNGDDLLNGSGSRDSLDGGAGNDTLRGGGNSDLLVGGDDVDLLLGDSLDHPTRGGSGNGGGDTLEGGSGADSMFGFFGNDLFRGGAGADSLFGGDGDDTTDEDDSEDVLDSIENVP